MTCGVEEDAERGARLVFGPARTEFEHCMFSGIEVVDHDVHVHLLGDVLARPMRRPELRHALEADALVTCRVADLAPTFVRDRLPIEQGAVELGEAARIVAVKDERGKACDCHAWHRMPGCGQIRTGICTAIAQRGPQNNVPDEPTDRARTAPRRAPLEPAYSGALGVRPGSWYSDAYSGRQCAARRDSYQ